MASMFGAFAAAGALQGVGEGMVHERNLQEALDTQYKLQQSGLDAAKQLDAAKKQTDEQDKLAQIRAKRGTLVGTDQEVASMYENQKKGMVTLGDGTDAMPGVPASLTPSNPQDATSTPQGPITPRTPSLQSPQLAAQQPPQPQAATPMPSQLPATGMPAPVPPTAVDPSSPAASVVAQESLKSITQAKQDGATDSDALLAGYPGASPAFKQEWSVFAKANGVTDAPDLQYLITSKGAFLSEGKSATDWYKDVVNPYLAAKEKNVKNQPIDTSQWGSQDQAAYSAMQREGLIGPAEKIKPLTTGQKKDNDTLVQQALNMKSAATQGIGTFQRIIQDTSKINPGPGSDVAAYIKSTWGQMTGTQRSQALNTFFEGQKETVNALNAQLNTMRQQGGRFVVGANVLEMEKKGIPDISKMPPEASLSLAQGYINNYKQIIGQADAIIKTPEEISPIKRVQFANAYAESNPTFGPDAQTPNPNWKEFADWRDGGTTSATTGTSNRAQATQDASSALANAKQGGPGTVAPQQHDNDPNIAAIQQGLPAGAKVTRIKKD